MLHNDIYSAHRLGNAQEDLERYAALFAKNDDPRDDQVLTWRFQNNPNSEATWIYLANDTSKAGEEAALYAVSGLRAFINSEVVDCAQSLDTLTDSQHRRQGLFPWLARETYSDLKAGGHAFVYGFPNGNSVHTFKKKLDWAMLDPVPFLIKPLRSGFFLRKLLPESLHFLAKFDFLMNRNSRREQSTYEIEEIDEFGPSHDALWLRVRETLTCGVERDSAYMNWRIVDYPKSTNYRALQAMHNGEVVAELAWTVEEKHGGRIGYILELLYDQAHEAAIESLMQLAVDHIVKRGGDAILAWSNKSSPNHRFYGQAGFFEIPEKLRPIELHWGVLPLQDNCSDILKNRDNWYLSYLDSDTV